jgi:catechol 2,3-dioxygenase-like lactoylglutathione lyase family enzyme
MESVIDHSIVPSRDRKESAEFYARVFGFEDMGEKQGSILHSVRVNDRTILFFENSSDPGSPWAIGGTAGGHKEIHPELGTLRDFKHLIAAAHEHGIEIAMDIAFQATPDHPYVREHPEWFLKRPDGSIKYAENPPKKYQDIYPFHFESAAGR